MPIVCNLTIIRRSKLTIKCNCSFAALGPKPGPRQIAPKKNSLVKQRKMTKVRLPPSSLLHPFLSGIYTQRETCG